MHFSSGSQVVKKPKEVESESSWLKQARFFELSQKKEIPPTRSGFFQRPSGSPASQYLHQRSQSPWLCRCMRLINTHSLWCSTKGSDPYGRMRMAEAGGWTGVNPLKHECDRMHPVALDSCGLTSNFHLLDPKRRTTTTTIKHQKNQTT